MNKVKRHGKCGPEQWILWIKQITCWKIGRTTIILYYLQNLRHANALCDLFNYIMIIGNSEIFTYFTLLFYLSNYIQEFNVIQLLPSLDHFDLWEMKVKLFECWFSLKFLSYWKLKKHRTLNGFIHVMTFIGYFSLEHFISI